MIYYEIKKVKTDEEAMRKAAGLCPCHQKSFAGVRWTVDGTEKKLTWQELWERTR